MNEMTMAIGFGHVVREMHNKEGHTFSACFRAPLFGACLPFAMVTSFTLKSEIR